MSHFVCVCVCCKYSFRFPTRIYIFPYSVLNKQHDIRLRSVTHKLVHVSLLLGQENGSYNATLSAGSGTGLPGLQFLSPLLAFQAVHVTVQWLPLSLLQVSRGDRKSIYFIRQLRSNGLSTYKAPGVMPDSQEGLVMTDHHFSTEM